MTKYVILSNIGNRNIKYHNQGYQKNEIPKEVFYKKTKDIYEHEEEWKNVSISILPAILEKYPDADLYLFTTQQEPVFDQDTYYEGLIIEKLLKAQNPNMTIQAIPCIGISAIDEDKLIPWYREQVNIIKRNNPDAIYIMYDSGGTPQQKNSLKAVVEFSFKRSLTETEMNEPGYLLFQGVDNFQGGTRIEQINKTASEKLAQLTNIRLLIQHNNYIAGKEIANSLGNKNLSFLLDYARLRWDNMWDELKKKYPANQFPKHIKNWEEFKVIAESDYSMISNQSEVSIDGLNPLFTRICVNLISKTKNQYLAGNFSGALLTFHQFIESYVYALIESHSEFKVFTDYRKSGEQLINEIKNHHNEKCLKLFNNIPYLISFPVLIFYAMELNDSSMELHQYVSKIRDTQSFFKSTDYPQNKKLDSLRNSIAHEGKGVSQEEYKLYLPLIEQSYAKFISKTDPFQSLNFMIEKLMFTS